jgi:hypothetical protein
VGLINWLEEHLQPCSYQTYLGFDCLGCGIQRSFIALLKGDFISSFYLYPALIPIISFLFLLTIHLVFKFKNGLIWLKYHFIIVLCVVVFGFLLKLVSS